MILVSVSNRILIKPIKPVHIYFGVTGGVICKTFKIWAPGILFLLILRIKNKSKSGLQSQPLIFIVHIIKKKITW